MAHSTFTVRTFQFLGHYEVHFGKDAQGFYLYEIEDLETLFMVDSKEGLTEEEFLGAVGCALDPVELSEFQEFVHSAA